MMKRNVSTTKDSEMAIMPLSLHLPNFPKLYVVKESKQELLPGPPNPSGKRAPILSDTALLFVRLLLDSRRRMDRGRQTGSRMHRKQHTN
jgi:hypothetical protein